MTRCYHSFWTPRLHSQNTYPTFNTHLLLFSVILCLRNSQPPSLLKSVAQLVLTLQSYYKLAWWPIEYLVWTVILSSLPRDGSSTIPGMATWCIWLGTQMPRWSTLGPWTYQVYAISRSWPHWRPTVHLWTWPLPYRSQHQVHYCRLPSQQQSLEPGTKYSQRMDTYHVQPTKVHYYSPLVLALLKNTKNVFTFILYSDCSISVHAYAFISFSYSHFTLFWLLFASCISHIYFFPLFNSPLSHIFYSRIQYLFSYLL